MDDEQLALHPAWVRHAPCAGTDMEFFPEDSAKSIAQTYKAIAFCKNTCPVIDECLLLALKTGSTHGVFGGTSGRQRREILGARKPIPEWGDSRHSEAVAEHRRVRGLTNEPAVVGSTGRAVQSEVAAKKAELAVKLLASGFTVKQAAESLGCAEGTIYRYARQEAA